MKVGRIIRRGSVALGAFTAAVLVLCLDGVDYRPFIRQPYYSETKARLRAHAATNTVVRGELAAGFGRAILSPTVNSAQDDPAQGGFRALPLAGYGSRHGRPAKAVHDATYVKAVALRVPDGLAEMTGAAALIIP